MFNPTKEKTAGWENDIRDDVILELSDHGGKYLIKKNPKQPLKTPENPQKLENPLEKSLKPFEIFFKTP